MKRCYLVNLKTGRKIKAKSVVQFCHLAKLTSFNDRIHIYPILRDERLQHKGWCLPKYFYTKITLRDCYGNVYRGKVKDFLYTYKVKPCTLWNLITEKKKVLRNLSLSSSNLKGLFLRPYRVTLYKFKTPNEKIVTGKTLRGVQKQVKNITYRSLIKLAHFQAENVKKYTLRDIIIQQRKELLEKR